MSSIDKRALRDAAEKATPGQWYVHDKPCEDGNYGIDTSDKEFLAEAVVWWGFSRQSIWREEDAKHIAAANPATVLALLDELEAKDQRIAELSSLLSDIQKGRPGGVYFNKWDAQISNVLRAAAAGKGEVS